MIANKPMYIAHLLVNILLLRIVICGKIQRQEGVVEVCQTEQFEASCGRNDEMILMTSAEYGRMRVSRCVQSDYGYIGCSSDVLGILDAACSGRRQCTVGVPSAALERAAAASCPGDLKLYLAASYRCIPVVVGDTRACLPRTTFVLTSRRGYISSMVAETTQRGTTQCPWIIEARRGQRINVTLWDFGVGRPAVQSLAAIETSRDLVQPCQAYAVIRERMPARSFTVCNQTVRTHLVYSSTSETVEIRILTGGHGKETQSKHFLLQYEIYGCPDAEAMLQPGYWFKRRGRQLEAGCTTSEDTWWLNCDGFNWIGESRRNCSIAGLMIGEAKEHDVLPWATSLAAVVVIAILLSVVIVTGGLFILGCHRRSRDRTNVNKPDDTYYRSHLKSGHCIDELHPEVVGESQYNTGNSRFAEHEYSYIADLQPPISSSGANFGQTGCTVEEGGQVGGEFDGSDLGLLGSGQPQMCRPVVECGAQKCRQVLRQRSMQLVDQPQQHLTPPFGSVVSLTDAATIAVRGVAPPPHGNMAFPPPAGKQNIGRRVYTGVSSFPPVSGYCASLENNGNH